VFQAPRSFLAQDASLYDVICLPLTDAYRPVTSGAYSLAENYILTVEACEAMLARLAPDGILVITRWLQTPPSESLRLIATVSEALQRRGAPPAASLVAYRGIQTITLLARPAGWPPDSLSRLRDFTVSRRYDLVWAPDIEPEETNRFNRLPAAEDYEALRSLWAARDPRAFYTAYPYAIDPPTDNRPFFFHFFRWRQTPAVLATLGRTWQPFGGSGYLVLLALLALVTLLSAGLVAAPLLARRMTPAGRRVPRLRALAYFALLGVAYVSVEIPLIQRWILVAGHPTYAFAAAVLTLLLFSGLGSLAARARWLPTQVIFGALLALGTATALGGGRLIEVTLGWAPAARLAILIASAAPLATLMGLPFPLGLAWLEQHAPAIIPWAWAINGCASVIASVLAAIAALGYGFTAVMFAGVIAYALAWLALWLPDYRFIKSGISFRQS
jgi:hypothetical protein